VHATTWPRAFIGLSSTRSVHVAFLQAGRVGWAAVERCRRLRRANPHDLQPGPLLASDARNTACQNKICHEPCTAAFSASPSRVLSALDRGPPYRRTPPAAACLDALLSSLVPRKNLPRVLTVCVLEAGRCWQERSRAWRWRELRDVMSKGQ
jgi:hypothetical protein